MSLERTGRSWSNAIAMISYLLFDLDNTLYPESSPLGAEIERRINGYAARYLGVSEQEADRLRQTEKMAYGTTMRWLSERHGMSDVEDYIEAVHPENVGDFIEKNRGLKALLESIPLPKSILTNSPPIHAHRILRYLDIEDCFEHVFDLAFSSYRGKPHPETYRSALAAIGKRAEEVAFIDDIPGYLSGFKALGGVAVLIDETGSKHVDDPEIKVVGDLSELPRLLASL